MMKNFVEIKGVLTNVDSIDSIGINQVGTPSVRLKTGHHVQLNNVEHRQIVEDLTGKYDILQVVAPHEKLFDLFNEDDENLDPVVIAYPVKWLAVCGDGQIRSFNFSEGYAEFEEKCDNYIGIFNKVATEEYSENVKFYQEDTH